MIEYDMTWAQANAIGWIEKYVEVKFKGKTKKEASEFIEKHIEKARKVEKERDFEDWAYDNDTYEG